MSVVDKINDIVEEKTGIKKDALINVLNDIDKLRKKYDPTTDEALTLAVLQDIISRLKRGLNIDKKLIDELERGFDITGFK